MWISNPFTGEMIIVNASYFEDCPRDENGRCKASGGGHRDTGRHSASQRRWLKMDARKASADAEALGSDLDFASLAEGPEDYVGLTRPRPERPGAPPGGMYHSTHSPTEMIKRHSDEYNRLQDMANMRQKMSGLEYMKENGINPKELSEDDYWEIMTQFGGDQARSVARKHLQAIAAQKQLHKFYSDV